MSSSRQWGFTLTEILVAALIIGVLAAVSIPNALQARVRGNDNAAQVILGTLASAQESRRADRLDYWPAPLGAEHAQVYDPTVGNPGGAFELLGHVKAPSEYRAYAVTLEDSMGVTHYCVGVMQHAHQSNAWVWTSRHVAEHTKIDREYFADKSITEFRTRIEAACLAEIN